MDPNWSPPKSPQEKTDLLNAAAFLIARARCHRLEGRVDEAAAAEELAGEMTAAATAAVAIE